MLSVHPEFHLAQEYQQCESNTSKWCHFECVLGGSNIYLQWGRGSPLISVSYSWGKGGLPKVFKTFSKEIMQKTFSCEMWMLWHVPCACGDSACLVRRHPNHWKTSFSRVMTNPKIFSLCLFRKNVPSVSALQFFCVPSWGNLVAQMKLSNKQ